MAVYPRLVPFCRCEEALRRSNLGHFAHVCMAARYHKRQARPRLLRRKASSQRQKGAVSYDEAGGRTSYSKATTAPLRGCEGNRGLRPMVLLRYCSKSQLLFAKRGL